MFKIRYADVSDAKDLAYIHATSWKVAYKGIIPDEVLKNITVEKREKYFSKVLTEGTEENAIIFEDEKVTLWVLEDNISARNFYEKKGFNHDGTINNISIGKCLNEYRYEKIIA